MEWTRELGTTLSFYCPESLVFNFPGVKSTCIRADTRDSILEVSREKRLYILAETYVDVQEITKGIEVTNPREGGLLFSRTGGTMNKS